MQTTTEIEPRPNSFAIVTDLDRDIVIDSNHLESYNKQLQIEHIENILSKISEHIKIAESKNSHLLYVEWHAHGGFLMTTHNESFPICDNIDHSDQRLCNPRNTWRYDLIRFYLSNKGYTVEWYYDKQRFESSKRTIKIRYDLMIVRWR